jgi:trigger factor
MGSPVKATVEELEDSKVLLEVEVPEGDVRHAIEHAASDLAQSMRIPGFRKGKVPLQVVAARVGREALWAEAVRTHIDGWFWDAAQDSGVRPVAGPEVEWDDAPEQGGTFRFRATVPVAPKPQVADWTTLEVPAADAEVPAELVDAELERLRESVAELVPVSGRPVQDGDAVVLDLVAREDGKEPSEHRDYVVELGTGQLADELETAVPGMTEGESREVALWLEDGTKGAVEVTVKEIKEKVLPALDDTLAQAATEFETLAELRADIEERLGEQLEAELAAQFRENAVDALVAASTIEGIDPLVDRRASSLLAGFLQTLEQRGIRPETYLTMTGQSPEALQQGMRSEAERALKRELVLEAVADQEGLEVSDEEVDELIREEATEAGEDPEQVIEAMRTRGGYEQLRGDLRLRNALDLVVAGVARIPVELAKAREKLWTPEKEKGGSGMKIWTPGSEEKP